MEDTSVLGYEIPKGTWVALSPSVAQRIQSVFPQPNGFCPHRFGPPREEDKKPFAFIAFGGGRHKCLGNAFAILQIKTILAILLQRYEFSLTDDPIEPDFQGLVIGPKAPARVRYRKLEEQVVEKRADETPEEQAAVLRPVKIVVDYDVCQGHGACEIEAPGVFKVDSVGEMTLLQEEPTADDWKKVHEAVRQCPQHALSLVELKQD